MNALNCALTSMHCIKQVQQALVYVRYTFKLTAAGTMTLYQK